LTFTTAATAASDVGGYPVTPGGLTSTDYAITCVAGSLSVTPAPLTVTVADATRLYGTANPAFTGTVSGVRNGDPITAAYSTTTTLTSPAGTYPIGATLSDGGTGKLADYAVTIYPGTLTVTAAPGGAQVYT